MPVNTYGGNAIFGVAVNMIPRMKPREIQKNRYPGVSGEEALDMGTPGRLTIVSGRFFEPTREDLALTRLTLESFHDGVARQFYDSDGTLWNNVLMGDVQWEGPVQSASSVGYTQRYTVVMDHLTPT